MNPGFAGRKDMKMTFKNMKWTRIPADFTIKPERIEIVTEPSLIISEMITHRYFRQRQKKNTSLLW